MSCSTKNSSSIELWIYKGVDKRNKELGKYIFKFTSGKEKIAIYIPLWNKRKIPRDIYEIDEKRKLSKIIASSELEQKLIKIIDQNLIRNKDFHEGEELNWLKHKILYRFNGIKNFELNFIGSLKALRRYSEEDFNEIDKILNNPIKEK